MFPTLTRLWTLLEARPLGKYVLTILIVGIALLFTLLMRPAFEVFHPRLIFFFAAIVIASWYGGFSHGMLATVLSVLAANYFLFEPFGTLMLSGDDFLVLLIFAAVSGGISWLEGMRRKANLENQQLVDQIEAEKRRFETVLQQMPAGVLIADAETGQLTLTNQRTRELTGYNYQPHKELEAYEAINGIVGIRQDGSRYAPDEWPLVRSLRTGEVVRREEITLIRTDGDSIGVSINSAPVRDESGQIIGSVATFEDISDRKRAEERTHELQELTAALTHALTPDEVAAVIVDRVLQVLKAHLGSVALLTPDRSMIELLRAQAPDGLDEEFRRVSIDAPGPLTESVRTGEMIFIETQEAYIARYPELADILRSRTGSKATACVPLRANEQIIGVIGVSFPEPQQFSRYDREFLITLADHCALALERARLYAVERAARLQAEQSQERWSFLAQASEILTSSLNYEETLKHIGQLCMPRIADWCTMQLVQSDGSLQQVVLAHSDPERVAWAQDLIQRYPGDPDAERGVPQVIRSGKGEFYPEIPDSMLVETTEDEELLKLLREVGYTAAMIVPMLIGQRVLGALSLVSAEQGRPYSPEDFRLAQELAKHIALAIENARLYHEVERQREQLQVTLQSIGDAVIATDADGRVTFINPVAQTLTGYTEHQAIGQPIEQVFNIINEQTREPVESPVAQVLCEGIIVGLANHTLLISHDGEESAIDDSGAPIRDTQGEIIGAVLVFRDITERKREERRRLLLYELSIDFAKAASVDEIGAVVMEKVVPAVDGHIGALALLSEDGSNLQLLSTTEIRAEIYRSYASMRLDAMYPLADAVRNQGLVCLEDQDAFIAQYPELAEDIRRSDSRAMISIPLFIQGEVVGVLGLVFPRPQSFTEADHMFYQTLGQECADALERVRLAEQVRETIALNERHRLARELHDAVSQSLFSATTIAQAVPILWKRDPERGERELNNVIALNRAAMAEMRTLLLELRPEAIVTTPLPDLLIQLLQMVNARPNLSSELRFEGNARELRVPPEVHLTLYRIAQESINNMLKHSQASVVTVTLIGESDQVILQIHDNGHGFDTRKTFSGLGLGSMRERAEGIGAQYQLESIPGDGTRISVIWRISQEQIPAAD